MAKPLGVIDTWCVMALDRLNLLPQLTLLFAQLLIPKAVRAELFRRRLAKDRIRALLREYAFMRGTNRSRGPGLDSRRGDHS